MLFRVQEHPFCFCKTFLSSSCRTDGKIAQDVVWRHQKIRIRFQGIPCCSHAAIVIKHSFNGSAFHAALSVGFLRLAPQKSACGSGGGFVMVYSGSVGPGSGPLQNKRRPVQYDSVPVPTANVRVEGPPNHGEISTWYLVQLECFFNLRFMPAYVLCAPRGRNPKALSKAHGRKPLCRRF